MLISAHFSVEASWLPCMRICWHCADKSSVSPFSTVQRLRQQQTRDYNLALINLIKPGLKCGS